MSVNKVSTVVQYGLSATILILFLLGGIGMYGIRSTFSATSALIHDNNSKLLLAHEMRDAIRQRQISLNKLLSLNDPFERDEELIRFYELAGVYRHARNKLIKLPMDLQESGLHVNLTETSHVSQPLNKAAAEHIANDDDPQVIKESVSAAFKEQQKLFDQLNQLVLLQDKHASEAVQLGAHKFDQSLLLVVTVGLFAVVIALFIVRKVSNYVEEKNSALLIATQAKSEFLATMSHEMRTPLTAIIGFAEASLDSEQSYQDRFLHIKTIIRSGKHLLQIINDILDLAKIEAKKLETETIKVSTFEILSDVEFIVRPQAEEKGLSFNIDYRLPLPECIETDPLRLKQILINLVYNSIKFTEAGRVFINVDYDEISKKLCFKVVDTGIGMTDEQLKKIFAPFTQADSSTTRKYGGTGLGLTLSKELAKKLGGDLVAESVVNIGSQFELSIGISDNPAIIRSAEEIPKFNHEKMTEAHSLGDANGNSGDLSYRGTILLAEDNPDNQRLLSHFIGRLGVDLEIAENGQAAINKASVKEFDLILMDMQMPVVGGLEAVSFLRKKGYAKPIVALTANAMRKDKEECLQAGCDEFLTKPIDRNVLYKTIDRFLQRVSKAGKRETKITSAILVEEPDMADIVIRFIDSLPATFDGIQLSEQHKQFDRLGSIIHQLKGSGGAMGFPILTELAGKIELQLANQNYTELKSLIEELGEIVDLIIGSNEMMPSSMRLAN